MQQTYTFTHMRTQAHTQTHIYIYYRNSDYNQYSIIIDLNI